MDVRPETQPAGEPESNTAAVTTPRPTRLSARLKRWTQAPDFATTPDRAWRDALLIGLLALTINLIGNGQTSLWDRDEPRYAGCVREMIARGDWIFPTFNAEPRFHKPILIYWMMAPGVLLAGDNPFGARMASAVAGTLVCLLTWGMGRRLFGPAVGRWAGLVLATAPIMVVESKLATTDACLLLWFVGSQWAVWELGKRPSKWVVGLFWSCLALSVMTKGPIGPALLAASGLAGWWWGAPTDGWLRLIRPLWPVASDLHEWRRIRAGFDHGGVAGLVWGFGTFIALFFWVLGRWAARNWGLMLFAALTLPWHIAIGILSQGEYFTVAFGYHVFTRMTTAIETHGGFPGYYAVLTIALLYPWSAVLPTGLWSLWKRRRERPEAAFLIGWILGPMLLLELARTKIIHYYLPAYPACALAVGWLIVTVARSDINLKRWALGGTSMGLLGSLGLAFTAAGIAGAFVLPEPLKPACVGWAVVIGLGTLFALDSLRHGRTERGAGALVGTWALGMMILFGAFLPALQPYRLPQIVAQRLAEVEAEEGAVPVLSQFKPPGVIYEIGHPVPEIMNRAEVEAIARRAGKPLVSALTPEEIRRIAQMPRMEVEERGVVEGFNIERFKNESLRLVLIRAKPIDADDDRHADSSIARGRATEPALVE